MKKILLTAIALLAAICVFAQDASSTASTVVRRKVSERNARSSAPGVTQRMQSHIDNSLSSSDDSELQWMRVMYRSLDLTKDANGALYYPDEVVGAGQSVSHNNEAYGRRSALGLRVS